MITRAAPGELAGDAASAAAVARRLGTRPLPCWLCAELGPGARPAELVASDPVEVVRGDSPDELAAAWARARIAWAGGPACPVGVGFLSYDMGRPALRLRSTPPAASGWPGLEFRFYDAFFVRSDGGAAIWAANHGAADALAARLGAPDPGPQRFALGAFVPAEDPARHLAGVARVLDYLAAGDVYQVNLARRLFAQLVAEGPPGLALFARLQAESPAPHAIWLGDGAGARALVGNSPERFLRLDPGGTIITEPIKGTRPRAPGVDPGAALAELAAHPKDRAEHVMIVDLERNDLGRICQTGTVDVVAPLRGVALPRVLHLVTTVRGQLRAGVELPEILAATFPGGSITGAPKRRAMEIIDELEPACRGPYTGATGWLGAAGDFDLAVAIRTALVERDRLCLWVGGGIVADSDPAAELTETEVKARAFSSLVSA